MKTSHILIKKIFVLSSDNFFHFSIRKRSKFSGQLKNLENFHWFLKKIIFNLINLINFSFLNRYFYTISNRRKIFRTSTKYSLVRPRNGNVNFTHTTRRSTLRGWARKSIKCKSLSIILCLQVTAAETEQEHNIFLHVSRCDLISSHVLVRQTNPQSKI